MVRSAAKNHAHVGIVTSPADYPVVLDELRRRRLALRCHPAPAGPRRLRPHGGLRRRHRGLARCRWPRARGRGPTAPKRTLGACAGARPLHLTLERTALLRYGENPHQRGARYRTAGASSWWDDGAAARRQGAVLPQPVRRRRRLAPGARAGGRCRAAGGGHHQARQPLRGRRGRQPGHRLRAGARVRRAVGLRRGGGHRRRGDRGAGRRHRRRAPGRRHHRLVLRARRAGEVDGAAQGHPAAVGARTRAGAVRQLRSLGSSVLVQDVDEFVVAAGGLDGGDDAASPPRTSGATWCWPGGCAVAPPPTPSPS